MEITGIEEITNCHKVAFTCDGRVFMIGGWTDSKGAFDACLELDFDNKVMVERARMYNKR